MVQVALSVVLLASAGLFVRSLEKLHAVDPGFHTRAVLDVSLFPKPGGYKNLALIDYYRELTDPCREGGIPKDCRPRYARRDLLEQFQPFRAAA